MDNALKLGGVSQPGQAKLFQSGGVLVPGGQPVQPAQPHQPDHAQRGQRAHGPQDLQKGAHLPGGADQQNLHGMSPAQPTQQAETQQADHQRVEEPEQHQDRAGKKDLAPKKIPGRGQQQLQAGGGQGAGHDPAPQLQDVQVIQAEEVQHQPLGGEQKQQGVRHLNETRGRQQIGRERQGQGQTQGEGRPIRPADTHQVGQHQPEQKGLVSERVVSHPPAPDAAARREAASRAYSRRRDSR